MRVTSTQSIITMVQATSTAAGASIVEVIIISSCD
jgi:hypothetical protein